jgi:hypothetical protein
MSGNNMALLKPMDQILSLHMLIEQYMTPAVYAALLIEDSLSLLISKLLQL